MQPVKTVFLFAALCVYAVSCIAKGGDLPQNFRQQSSLLFIENKGQITDQHGTVRHDIDFKLQTPGITMFIGNGQLHYQWVKQSQDSKVKTQKFNPKGQLPNPKDMFPMGGEEEMEQGKVSTYRMDVTLVGANRNAQVIAEEPDAYYENYITPNTGEKGVSAHTYRKLTYKNIYPNIDWVLYVSGGEALKYDFIIHPGGNPNDIQLRYGGATELKLQDGALTATTPYGSITEQAPYSYMAETNQQVASSFILNGNTISFQVEKQLEGTLVIDPQLHWATYYGDGYSGTNYCALSVNDSGYIYMLGHTRDIMNIATAGTFQSTMQKHGSTGYVTKFDKDGNRVWGTYYGEPITGDYCRFYSIAVGGNSGDVYVGGGGQGVSLTTGSAHELYARGGLLVKLNSSGQRVWASFLGNRNADVNGISVFGDNHLYITGSTNSDSGITTANAYKTIFTGTTSWYAAGNAYLMKLDTSGVRQWGTYFGDTLQTESNAIVSDNNGDVIIAGRTYDTRNISTQGAHQEKIGSDNDGFITRFDSTGNIIWGTYYGGEKADIIREISSDGAGNVYICGSSGSDTGIATQKFCQSQFNGINLSFMAKLNRNGQRIWGSYLPFRVFTIDVNSNGYLMVGGDVKDNNLNLATVGSHQWVLNGTSDALLAKFDLDGKFGWATYFGGNKGDVVTRIKISDSMIFLCGLTNSTQGLVTGNVYQATITGNINIDFLGRMDYENLDTVIYLQRLSKHVACAGDTVQVNFDVTPYVFPSTNKFIVELSNSTGSFTNPIVLDNANTNMSCNTQDSIKVVVPVNTATGNYRIRIVSSEFNVSSGDSAIDVYQYPNSPTISGKKVYCEEDTLILIAADGGADVVYKWVGPDGFASSSITARINNVSNAAVGKYIVLATRGVCSVSDTADIIVKPLPSKPLATHNGPICENDTVKINSTSATSTVSYTWSGPQGFVAASKDTFIANSQMSMSGYYIVSVSLNGCMRKDTAVITVKPLPQNLSATVNSPVCAGTTLQFNATTTTNGVTWKWQGPNGFAPISSNPVIGGSSPIHNGDYVVAATLNGCTVKDTATVLVNPIPAKPVLGVNTPICVNYTLRLTGSSSTAGVTYSWAGPASFTGTAGDTSFYAGSTSATGQYTLTASKDGCSNADNITITVKPIPASVTLSNDGPVCEGSTLNIISTASTTNASYAWTGPNGFNAASQSTSISNAMPTASGWYKLVVALNGCSITDSTQAVVNATPIINNTSANQPLCVSEMLSLSTGNINNATYSWSGPNNYTANGRTPVRNNMQFSDTGWYRIVATANNCVSAPDSVYVKANPLPFVVITTTKDSICKGDMASFIGLPNSHGGTPTYSWLVNGIPSGTGTTFSTTTLNDGDIISCNMTEYTKCSAQYIDESNDITMNVLPWLLPSVYITASPPTPVKAGDPIQFSSTQANGGKLPAYQWKQNGANIQGATSNIWSASTLNDNDEICLEMTSNYMCPQPPMVKSNCIIVKVLTGISDNKIAGSLQLYPNPNNGHFTIKGQILKGGNEAINIEVLNPLGQVVYTGELQPKQGNIHHEIQLPQVASGSYMLRMYNADIREVLQFNVK